MLQRDTDSINFLFAKHHILIVILDRNLQKVTINIKIPTLKRDFNLSINNTTETSNLSGFGLKINGFFYTFSATG